MHCVCILLFDKNLNSQSLLLPSPCLVVDDCRDWWATFWVLQLLLLSLQVLAVLSLIVLCLGSFGSLLSGFGVLYFDPAHISLFWVALVYLLGLFCFVYFIFGLLDLFCVIGFSSLVFSSWAGLCFAVVCLAVLFLIGLYFWPLLLGTLRQSGLLFSCKWQWVKRRSILGFLFLIPSLFDCLLVRIVLFHLWSLIRWSISWSIYHHQVFL